MARISPAVKLLLEVMIRLLPKMESVGRDEIKNNNMKIVTTKGI